MSKIPIILLWFVLLTAGCSAAESKEKELTVSAAASLQDALKEIRTSFEKEHPAIHIQFNFGSSGALQQQISQGAPADLYISAAEEQFDRLVQQGLMLDKGTILAGNELVLAVPKDSPIQSFQDLSKAKRISIGTPETVPAGRYAKESLENQNVWSAAEEKIVYAKDVRQVLTYVETGNVDAGIVYKTDVLSTSNMEIADTAGQKTHSPILYPAGIVKNTAHLREAKLFYTFLQSDSSKRILEEYGFKGLN
ncbi:molybdate ABC transporter substrate-binding protein [Bacillus mangrovi]|uniref:Molybdate ABC transporter substrate-binding protein n=1 Tax=Metabacillus mangrovi TaxID=1491830 RepID=A0A7X2S536_9BACI|nr:molybdate ABC transporter substrate-binding protein [Metabacillus mangrovi]MTH53410.1 molybdate ABC transporter substrate-binding protein [Metabacillus mangrovi]